MPREIHPRSGCVSLRMMKIDPGRRLLLGGLAALPAMSLPWFGALAVPAPLQAPAAPAQPIRFDVRRGSASIGTHTVRFRREGADLIVDIDIELEVKLAFVTVYRYRHTNREIWRGGRLVGIDARTNDDGEELIVRATPFDDALRVEGKKGTFMVPADTLSTSYWNAETVRRSQLIDTQHGSLAAVTSTPVGTRIVQTAGGPVEAACWRVGGDLDLEICYAADGAWVGLDFEARGSRITYTRAAAAENAG